MPGYRATTAARQDIDILVRGSITTQDITRAQAAIAGSLDAGPPVERVRLKMAEYRDRRHSPVCVVQINLEVAGRLVRAQEWAPSLTDALGKAAAVLPGRARRLERHLSRMSRTRPVPPSFADEIWEHRAARFIPPVVRPLHRARGLARHKAVAPAAQSPDAAAATMELRDYDFHLFTEDDTGLHGVVYRSGPSAYRLATADPRRFPERPTAVPLVLDRNPLPELTLPEAAHALDVNPLPFLTFVAVATGQLSVIYRRYDGHLALITPLW